MSLESTIREAADTNAEYLAKLSSLNEARPALEKHRKRIPELEKTIPTLQKTLKSVNETASKELKEWESYRDSKIRRWAHSLKTSSEAKFEERTAKEKQEYEEAAAKVFDLEQKIQGLEKELEEAKTSIPQLETDTKAFNETQALLDGLYDSIFGGPTPSHPDEDRAEEAEKQAHSECERLSRAVETNTKFLDVLKQAEMSLARAVDRLDSAETASTLDTIGVFDTFAGLHKRECWDEAKHHIKTSKDLLARAKEIRPDMVDLQMENVNVRDKSFAVDIVFDNIFSDVDFHRELEAMLQLAGSKRAQAKAAVAKETEDLKSLYAQKNAAVGDWKNKKAELQQIRESIFSYILNQDTEKA